MKDTTIENEFDRLFIHFKVNRRAALCEKIGVPLGTYDTWKTRGRIPELPRLKIAKDAGINPEWIRTGNGEKFLESDGEVS